MIYLSLVDSCCGNRIELLFRLLVNVEAMPVNVSMLRRSADCRFCRCNGCAGMSDLSIALARDRVKGGSIRFMVCLFNDPYERFSAG